MTTVFDLLRKLFEHERDSNAKVITMLESVPEDRRKDPDFTKALEKTSHIFLARRLWLFRLGHYPTAPASLFPVLPIPELKALMVDVEKEWSDYFAKLSEAELPKSIEYVRAGQKVRYVVEKALIQVGTHAFYHRGQIGMLVARLGGSFVDTDYVFWDKFEVIGNA
jgi:uncharacterized damage-inducible protein DinB